MNNSSKFNLLILKVKTELNGEADALIKYFEKCYVNGKVLNTRTSGAPRFTPPLFPPEIWSVYQNNQEGYPRTQNKVEAWHRR